MNTIANGNQEIENAMLCMDHLDLLSVDSELDENNPEYILTKSDMIRIAVKNTVNQIWLKYKTDGNQFLSRREIKTFLKDFLKGQKINEIDLHLIMGHMDGDAYGRIDKHELAAFILRITSFDKLIKPRHIEKKLGFKKTESQRF